MSHYWPRKVYRLRIDGKDKIFLQGWALVENTSDDDWNDIRMVLVWGKPISFKMNLYDPIYIPRPFVEPEMFASFSSAGVFRFDGGYGSEGGRLPLLIFGDFPPKPL
jgi:hypothetical protein